METGAAIVSGERHATNGVALVSEVKAISGARTDKQIGRLFCATEILGNLIDRCQSGASCNADDVCIGGRCDRHTVRSTQVNVIARRELIAALGKLANIDDRQANRVVGQAGKRLFAHAGNPDKNVFPCANIQIAVERDDGDVLTDHVIGDHAVGFKCHVDVKSNELARLFGAAFKIVGHGCKVGCDIGCVHPG